ncbi:MAG TPA: hypothetical protein VHT91_02365 [Kofleriaceae bacterium]|nr:hypothetical protein [Kofleriaceae bacterium]
MARKLNKGAATAALAAPTGSRNMSYLENIATRQRRSRLRDALFALFVALAAITAVTTVTKAVVASSQSQHR